MSSVSAADAAADILAGVKVVDVRTAYRHGIDGLPDSSCLPLDEIEAGAVPEGIGETDRLYLVCEVGGFSELAVAYLHTAGFTGARSVRGGLAALRPLLLVEPDTSG